MAKRGRVYLIGPGNNRVNPIHGADLAVSCVDAMDGERQEIDVGGPEVFTYRQIAKLAFETQGKPVKITSVPVWLMKFIVATIKVINKHKGDLLDFFTTGSTVDFVAPITGTHRLKEHYIEQRA